MEYHQTVITENINLKRLPKVKITLLLMLHSFLNSAETYSGEITNLSMVARQAAYEHLNGACQIQAAEFYRSAAAKLTTRPARGLFVTLVSFDGRPRGCWGSTEPMADNLYNSVRLATHGALTKDYRQQNLVANELAETKFIVTTIDAVTPLNDLRNQNPRIHGLLIKTMGRSGLSLPGESLTVEHQLRQCLHKARLRRKDFYRMYRLTAHVEL